MSLPPGQMLPFCKRDRVAHKKIPWRLSQGTKESETGRFRHIHDPANPRPADTSFSEDRVGVPWPGNVCFF
jgi:hypothetical protein